MCRAIKIHGLIFYLCFILLMQGCFLHSVTGHGYSADITVSSHSVFTVEDIQLIDYLAGIEQFIDKRISTLDQQVCVYFGKDLNESGFYSINHKFILMAWCYDIEASTKTQYALWNMTVYIYNDWEGQNPVLKQEIDRLADVIYKELVKRFGDDNVRIERRKTGPPF